MTLTSLGPNKTEVTMSDGLTVLFSYKTPVACRWTNRSAYHYYKTDKHRSSTTTRHINSWLGGNIAIFKSQEYFDNLLAEVK